MAEKWKMIHVQGDGNCSYFAPDGYLSVMPAADLIHQLDPNAKIRVPKREEHFELIRLLLADGWEPFAAQGAIGELNSGRLYSFKKRVEG